MSEELKSCPFCGGAPYSLSSGRIVQCNNCFAETDLHDNEAEAIAAWNSRASDSKVAALVEALKPFVNLVAKNEEGESSDELAGLPDGHAFELIWRFDHRSGDATGDRSPWVSAGQFRRAIAAIQAIEGE